MVLDWITKKIRPTDNAASSEASLQGFLETLPPGKPALALHDIGERFVTEAEFELDAAICRRALSTLDQAAQAAARMIAAGDRA